MHPLQEQRVIRARGMGRRSNSNFCTKVRVGWRGSGSLGGKGANSEPSASTEWEMWLLPPWERVSVQRGLECDSLLLLWLGGLFLLLFLAFGSGMIGLAEWPSLLIKFTWWRKHFVLSQTMDEDRIWKHMGKTEQTYLSWGQKRISRRTQKELMWMRVALTRLPGPEGSVCDTHKCQVKGFGSHPGMGEGANSVILGFLPGNSRQKFASLQCSILTHGFWSGWTCFPSLPPHSV